MDTPKKRALTPQRITVSAFFLLAAIFEFVRMLAYWRQGNPPLAILRAVFVCISVYAALYLLFGPEDETSASGEALPPRPTMRPVRAWISRVVDEAPIAIPLFVGGLLFIGGAVGILTSNEWDLNFVGYGASCGLGFYVLKRALSVRDI